ncbi:helix-turn-helix domain-containing protein [Corynebacterium variabile]|jgi:excisionase family DNA binding protein|uniref:helix-turn-helix domain-containing protein n=1 Tax=Corynebacterium variabile TaxID=1727 RepID=UPI003FD4026A
MSTTITVRQAASLLGISKGTADRWLLRGTFPTPAYKIENSWIIPARPLLVMLGYSTDEVDATIQDTLAAA